MKKDFTPKTIVKNDQGHVGVICPDLQDYLNIDSPEEVPVVYEGVKFACGTDWRELTIIGTENAKADLTKCAAGNKNRRCIFLGTSMDGIATCLRFGLLHWSSVLGTKGLTGRHPVELFPNCQRS